MFLRVLYLLQLARTGLVDDIFSLCYGFPAGGTMLLGESICWCGQAKWSSAADALAAVNQPAYRGSTNSLYVCWLSATADQGRVL
jgi:hypothetical protein